MIEYKLKSVEDIHKFFRVFRSHRGLGTWYRGQANVQWPLLPKAGRENYFLPDNRDLGRLNEWLETAIAYEKFSDNYLESLAIAQHHGLATRLLDWSQNPLVAAFFAVNEYKESDGALYLLECMNDFFTSGITEEALIEYEGVVSYIPRAVTGRILQQQALFTIHCPPNKEIEICKSRVNSSEPNLRRIIIPASLKEDILKMLNDYGIAENTLFPGLDGLSDVINRETLRMSENARNKLKMNDASNTGTSD